MRQILLLILFFTGTSIFCQTSVSIFPKDQFLCYGGAATFYVFIIPDTADNILRWSRNGVPITVEDSVQTSLVLENLTFADTGFYTVSVVNSSGTFNSDTVYLHLRQTLTIDTLYRFNKPGCPGTCKGQMKVQVSGGTEPYTYNWGGGFSQDSIVTSLCKGEYLLTVYDTDSSSCISRKYEIKVLVLPKISFVTVPQDTVFLTNPLLKAAFDDTALVHLSNWEWIFYEGKDDSTLVPGLNPAEHIYRKSDSTFLIKLNYTDVEGCDTTVQKDITVMIADLFIPNVFTPNADKVNDNFVIQIKNAEEKTLADVYLSNELIVLNRWGTKVYNKKNYLSTNDIGEWDGGNLAEGVYFYIFTGKGYYGDDVWKGSVTILGRKGSPENSTP